MKVSNIIEDVLIATGLTIALTDIHQILSIIILVFNVCWILWKCGYGIYKHVKNKNLDEVEKQLEDAKNELEELDSKLPKKDDSKDE